jgi:hypothetical protein
MDRLISKIESLDRYGVPDTIILKIIVDVYDLYRMNKSLLEIYKAKIASLVKERDAYIKKRV